MVIRQSSGPTGWGVRMARYHFTLSDSTTSFDPEGTELESLATAQSEAIIYAAESLKERSSAVLADGSLQVRVTDDDGLNLFQVTVIVTNAAPPV